MLYYNVNGDYASRTLLCGPNYYTSKPFSFTQFFTEYSPSFITNVLRYFLFPRSSWSESLPKELKKTSNEVKIQVSQVINNWNTQLKPGGWAEPSKYNR